MSETFVRFVNCRLCRNGEATSGSLTFSPSRGLIVEDSTEANDAITDVDLGGKYLAPGFIEVQTNGLLGFHFTHFTTEDEYNNKLDQVARFLPSHGVTGFYPTIPTVRTEEFQQILPSLKPREVHGGATILGAHCEGPYLHASKKGAHNASLFKEATIPPHDVYGRHGETLETIKIVTLAPELDGSSDLVKTLVERGVKVSLGHSSATFDQGMVALRAGASLLTHTLNAMAPLHHREPGLAGLITVPNEKNDIASPYYSIIPDGNHLHPRVASLLFRANAQKCIFTTDSIELSGLPDGVYPGHSQIPFNQTKKGSRVVIEGTDTLIGGCASLQECVQNMVRWSGCSIAEGVRCVTENVVAFTGDSSRGVLKSGRRADFVILDDEGNVVQTYVSGKRYIGGDRSGK